MVRRRLVFYVEGYDPQGLTGYSRLFRREYRRFLTLWTLAGRVSEPEVEPGGYIGHWTVETAGPNWRVETRYEFLNWDDLIRSDLARPLVARLARMIAVFAAHLLDGTARRLFRASWRFGLFYLYCACGLVFAAASTSALALSIAWALSAATGSLLAGAFAAVVLLAGAWFATSWIGKRAFLTQLAEWILCFADWAHDRRPDLSARIDHFARHMMERMRAAQFDEVLIVGHSAGGAVAVATLARMLELDASILRAGPRVAIAGLGSVVGAAGLHRPAASMRRAVARLAVEEALLWVECESRKDVMNLWAFDPVEGLGLELAQPRRNPTIWRVSLKDTFAPQSYEHRRADFFRLHFQFIMANDCRARYDFFMFVCGPVPFAQWARDDWSAVMAFGPDGALLPDLAESDARAGQARGAAALAELQPPGEVL